MTNQSNTEGEVIWVLLDAPEDGDLARYAGPVQIDAQKLKQHFQSFTSVIAKALEGCKPRKGDFELSEIAVEAKLTAEAGFALVSKAGVEGTVGFKFERRTKETKRESRET